MYKLIGGRLREFTIPATAGNAAYTTITPNPGTVLVVVSGIITLVCDATVANRTITVGRRISAGGVSKDIVISTGNITASQTKTLAFNRELHLAPAAYAYSDYQAGIGWVLSYAVTNPDLLMIYIPAGVAGDSYSGYIQCFEHPA